MEGGSGRLSFVQSLKMRDAARPPRAPLRIAVVAHGGIGGFRAVAQRALGAMPASHASEFVGDRTPRRRTAVAARKPRDLPDHAEARRPA